MFVSIDIKTTGLDTGICQILEIGAILVDYDTPLADCPTFHCYIDNEIIIGQPYSLALHSHALNEIAHKNPKSLKPDEVVPVFEAFLDGTDIIASGNFDAKFLSKLPGWGDLFFSSKVLDPAMLYWEPDIDGHRLPSINTCLMRAGFPARTNTALEDAIGVAKLIRHRM